MSIGTFLKEYREANKLRQQDLANRFEVTNMTISRLESGKQVVLSPKMVKNIGSLLTAADIEKFDENDAQEKKLIAFFNRGEQGPDAPWDRTEDLTWHKEILTLLDSKMQQIGFYTNDGQSGYFSYLRLYYNPALNKYWAISEPFFMRKDLLQRHLFSSYIHTLGRACFDPFLNKISFLTASENWNDSYLTNLLKPAPERVPCDISMLFVNQEGIVDGERDLYVFKDGKGLFDLDSPDLAVREKAASLFAKWKLSLQGLL